jgi:hypothetical protein
LGSFRLLGICASYDVFGNVERGLLAPVNLVLSEAIKSENARLCLVMLRPDTTTTRCIVFLR